MSMMKSFMLQNLHAALGKHSYVVISLRNKRDPRFVITYLLFSIIIVKM